LTEIEAKWDSTKAMNATLDALQRFPDANTIFVMADCMLSGVIEALKTQSKLFPVDDERHITIVSVDADPSGVKYLKEGYVDFIAEHNAALHSDIAAKVIIDYFHGKQIPKQIYFEPFGVTKDNVNDPNRWGNYDFKDINNWPVMKHDRYVMQTTK
jgi:ABC-type sugar transport system substrate-binding protein